MDLVGIVLGVSLGGTVLGFAAMAKAVGVLKRLNPSLEQCLHREAMLQRQLEEYKARVAALEDRIEELKKRLQQLGEPEALRGLVLYYAYKRGIIELKPKNIVLLDDCIVIVREGGEGKRFCLDELKEELREQRGEKHD